MAINWGDTFKGFAKGAAAGGAVGSLGGPVGTAIGGVVGGAAGAYKGATGKKLFQGRNAKAEESLSGYQFDIAKQQQAQADRINAELDAMGRPVMDAKVQQLEAVADMTANMAREGMPSAQREFTEQNIQQAAAQQLSAAQSLGGGMRAIGDVGASTAQQYRNLNAQDAAAAQQNQIRSLQAQQALAGAYAEAEMYNEIAPYQELMASANALQGASIQNMMGGYQTEFDAAQGRRQRNADLAGGAMQLGGQLVQAYVQSQQ